jgi:hypothetical protein
MCGGNVGVRSTLRTQEDLGVYCRSLSAWTLWYLGYPDQALARSQEALTLAQQRAHPLSLSQALGTAAQFHQFCRDVCAAQEYAEASMHLAVEQGFPLITARGAVLRSWALAGLLVKRGHLTRPSFAVSRTFGASRPGSLPMTEGPRCPQAQSLALGMYQ